MSRASSIECRISSLIMVSRHHDRRRTAPSSTGTPSHATQTLATAPRSSRLHVSKGVIDRAVDPKFDDGTDSITTELEGWASIGPQDARLPNTQLPTHSSRPHVSKGVIDRGRTPSLMMAQDSTMIRTASHPTVSNGTQVAWPHKHGWPRSSRPHKSGGVIDEVEPDAEVRRTCPRGSDFNQGSDSIHVTT